MEQCMENVEDSRLQPTMRGRRWGKRPALLSKAEAPSARDTASQRLGAPQSHCAVCSISPPAALRARRCVAGRACAFSATSLRGRSVGSARQAARATVMTSGRRRAPMDNVTGIHAGARKMAMLSPVATSRAAIQHSVLSAHADAIRAKLP
ncbi:hypothetical protein AcV5_009532 [Taiwanofungus camphoratus]|nr:hypothetical protein AcV5_009532 [Antrodia cinnamomea]